MEYVDAYYKEINNGSGDYSCLQHPPCLAEFCKRVLLAILYSYHKKHYYVGRHATQSAACPDHSIVPKLVTSAALALTNVDGDSAGFDDGAGADAAASHHEIPRVLGHHESCCRLTGATFMFPLFGGNALNCFLPASFILETDDLDFACLRTHWPRHQHDTHVWDELCKQISAFQQTLNELLRQRYPSTVPASDDGSHTVQLVGKPYIEMHTYPAREKISLYVFASHQRRMHIADFQRMALDVHQDQQLVRAPRLHFRHESTRFTLPWMCCLAEYRLAQILSWNAHYNSDVERRAMDYRRWTFVRTLTHSRFKHVFWTWNAPPTTTTTSNASVATQTATAPRITAGGCTRGTQTPSPARPRDLSASLNSNSGGGLQCRTPGLVACVQHIRALTHTIQTTFTQLFDRLHTIQAKHQALRKYVRVKGPQCRQRIQARRRSVRHLRKQVHQKHQELQQWEECKTTYQYYAHMLEDRNINDLLRDIGSMRSFDTAAPRPSAPATTERPLQSKSSSRRERKRNKKKKPSSSSSSTRPSSGAGAGPGPDTEADTTSEDYASWARNAVHAGTLEQVHASLDEARASICKYVDILDQKSDIPSASVLQNQRFIVSDFLAENVQRHFETGFRWRQHQTVGAPMTSHICGHGVYILQAYLRHWAQRHGYAHMLPSCPQQVRYNPFTYFAVLLSRLVASCRRQPDRATNSADTNGSDTPHMSQAMQKRHDEAHTAWELFTYSDALSSTVQTAADRRRTRAQQFPVPVSAEAHADAFASSVDRAVPDDLQDDPPIIRVSDADALPQLLLTKVYKKRFAEAHMALDVAASASSSPSSSEHATVTHTHMEQFSDLLDHLWTPLAKSADRYVAQQDAFRKETFPEGSTYASKYFKMFERHMNPYYRDVVKFHRAYMQACTFMQYLVQISQRHRIMMRQFAQRSHSHAPHTVHTTQRLLDSYLKGAFCQVENAMQNLIWFANKSCDYALYAGMLRTCIAYGDQARRNLDGT